MRVLRVLPELDFGGVESRVLVQSRLHDKRSYELVVCAFHKAGMTARAISELGIRVDVLNLSPAPRNPRATLGLARYLRQLRPDVVHASIAEANLHSLVAARAVGVKVRIAEETGMPSHSRLARNVYRGVYRFASTVVGVTNAVCDYVRLVDRAPADRVRLIYNCADPGFFPDPPVPLHEHAAAQLGVLLVGRLVPVKNQLFFVEVLKRVLPAHPSVQVLIAGDGPLRSELERATSGMADRVQLLGARSDVPALLRQSQLFALPSVSEGCSISLIEAMASGVHAIGSDVPGIREVMGPLANDWTAPPGDLQAWVKLLGRALALSPAQRLELALSARRRAYEVFSPAVYVRTLDAMYRELVGVS